MTDHHLDQLRATARYHRERYDLYRAKAYGQRPTSPARLRELHLACQTAEARLKAAEQTRRAAPADLPVPTGDRERQASNGRTV